MKSKVVVECLMLKTTLAATVLATSMLALSPSAEAKAGNPDADTRPCVDNSEVWHVPAGLTRRQVEDRWEVRGLGREMVLQGSLVWMYPRCDPPPAGYTTNVAYLQLNSQKLVIGTGIYQD